MIVSLLFEEGIGEKGGHVLEKARWISSSLLEAEVYSAARREKIPLELAAAFVQRVSLVYPEGSLQKEYLAIFRQGYVRGADAYHLATALYLDPECQNLNFATVDKRQAELAEVIGFHLVPL